jgi:hypothetical protein
MTNAGVILKKHIGNADLQVSWEWYDKQEGIVQWNFRNAGNAPGSGLLFRATYPFGNAFWPIYVDNPEFDTHFSTLEIPLIDRGVENNSPPLAVFQNPDKFMFVAFVFTLSPGQEWSMLEAGFINGLTPDYEGSPKIIPAVKSGISSYNITWSPDQCSGYNQQTGDNLPCPPNPLKIQSAVYQTDENIAPIFNDLIEPENAKTCLEKIIQGIQMDDIDEIIAGLECEFGSIGSDIINALKK